MIVYVIVLTLATTQFVVGVFTKFVSLIDLIVGVILLGFGAILLLQNIII